VSLLTSNLALWFGQATLASIPKYWSSDDVNEDGGTAFPVTVTTMHVAPAGLGGECVFRKAWVTVTASAGCTLKLTPIIDGSSDAVSGAGGTVSFVTPIFTMAQQGGTPAPRVTQTFPIVLSQKLDVSGIEQSRWYCRGSRCAIKVETVGAVGSGELIIDGIELEHEVIRRSIFDAVTL
jgi:hypothetical protein